MFTNWRVDMTENVNYIYGVLLLHSAGKEINEENLKKVVEAVGVKPDEAMIKSVVSSLEGVNIDEAISQAVVAAAPAAAAQEEKAAEEEKKEEKEKQEEKAAEEAAAGLGSLFG